MNNLLKSMLSLSYNLVVRKNDDNARNAITPPNQMKTNYLYHEIKTLKEIVGNDSLELSLIVYQP